MQLLEPSTPTTTRRPTTALEVLLAGMVGVALCTSLWLGITFRVNAMQVTVGVSFVLVLALLLVSARADSKHEPWNAR